MPQLEIVEGFIRPLQVLCMSGVWCGDCVRQGPILERIANANPGLEVRFIDNHSHPELLNELRINGAMKVPVAVFLSEDFFELARFGDRHLGVYRMKLATETGPACATGLGLTDALLAEDIQAWVDVFERVHAIVRLAPFYREKYAGRKNDKTP